MDLAKEPDEYSGEVARWVREIKYYERDSSKWVDRSKKIILRYKDERTNSRENNTFRFNILWSNIQTLKPALFAQNPKPNIERRFQDDDDLGRISAQVLERATDYFVNDKFYEAMKQAVLDRLLSGRGTIWIRYIPHMRDVDPMQAEIEEGQITDDVMTSQELYDEEVCPDYVHWEDFGHTSGRTWEEVSGVWRRVFMTRDDLVKRFGEVGKSIPLDYSPEKLNDEKVPEVFKKAVIYEIWCKTDKKVYWIHRDYPEPLDVKEDPLKLKGFFPCPQPMFATLANDSCIPVPDYLEYQDQAMELDNLTARIHQVTKAIKVAGVYDTSAQGVERLLSEGVDNILIPVESWAIFAEKGGLKGAIDILPIDMVLQSLLSMYEAREKVKQDLYEISGISDIVRGVTNANETATAQRIKGNFATLRLDEMQRDVQRFARDLIRIMTEIIAEHFSQETLRKITGVKLMTAVEKQFIQSQMQIAQQQGAQIPPPPEEIQEGLSDPTWEEVMQLIKDDTMRCYKIDIETDSTIKMDQTEERNARTEFLTAVGGFMAQAQQVQDPALRPLVMQMLMFGMRGFKTGRELETAFKIAMNKIENKPPQPDPAAQEAQMKVQAEQEKVRIETQADLQKKQMELAADEKMKIIEIQSKERIAEREIQAEIEKKRIEVSANALMEANRPPELEVEIG